MKTTILLALACAFITPVTFSQTIITLETTTTTQTVATLDSNVMSVNTFAPGDKIVVQTSPDTQPITVALDKGVAYVAADGRPIDTSSIRPGSRVRLEFVGTGPEHVVARVVMVNP